MSTKLNMTKSVLSRDGEKVGKIPIIGIVTWTFFWRIATRAQMHPLPVQLQSDLTEGQTERKSQEGRERENEIQGKPDEVKNAVNVAIDAGYRHIDCAWIYKTENSVGEAIQENIAAGVVKREDMFITTKLWHTHHNPTYVRKALKHSLRNLQLDYIDMYVIHWPTVLKAMEECQKEGLTRNIGLSNFNSKQTDRIINSCTIKPTYMQIEVSPYLSNKEMVDYCKSHRIVVTAYSPLGAVSRPWKKANEPNTFEDPVLKEIAANKGKSIAQLFSFQLTEEEMDKISALNQDLRAYKELANEGHPEFPFDLKVEQKVSSSK